MKESWEELYKYLWNTELSNVKMSADKKTVEITNSEYNEYIKITLNAENSVVLETLNSTIVFNKCTVEELSLIAEFVLSRINRGEL